MNPGKQHPLWTRRLASGFTLIELMVVIAIVGVLAAIGIPRFTAWILQGHLQEAKPYLMAIAAKERMHKTRTGTYYPSTSETDLEDTLGVDLKDASNFCFVVRTGTANSISASATAEGFEVWAILNNQKVATLNTLSVDPAPKPPVTCTLTSNETKLDPTGWVKAPGTIGGQGRVVVLRYPPRGDGLDTQDRSERPGVKLDWVNGISITDPLL